MLTETLEQAQKLLVKVLAELPWLLHFNRKIFFIPLEGHALSSPIPKSKKIHLHFPLQQADEHN